MSTEAPKPQDSQPPQRVWVTTIQIVGLVAALGGVFWALIWTLSEPGRLQSVIWPMIVVVLGGGMLVRLLLRRPKG